MLKSALIHVRHTISQLSGPNRTLTNFMRCTHRSHWACLAISLMDLISPGSIGRVFQSPKHPFSFHCIVTRNVHISMNWVSFHWNRATVAIWGNAFIKHFNNLHTLHTLTAHIYQTKKEFHHHKIIVIIIIWLLCVQNKLLNISNIIISYIV